MDKKIKVLIGDDSAEYGVACANELRSLDFYVVTRCRNGKVILDAIHNDQPDVVVIDAILPNMDAIEILEKTRSMEHRPAFIVTSTYENLFIERQIMENGASYFMIKPFEIAALGNRILTLMNACLLTSGPYPRGKSRACGHGYDSSVGRSGTYQRLSLSPYRHFGVDSQSVTAGERDETAVSNCCQSVPYYFFPCRACHSSCH